MDDTARILVVDDQKEILDLTSLVLGRAGYATTLASSGAEALKHLAQEPFDLVLLDINMPEMDGWETLRLLRADEQASEPVVVMFSIKGEIIDKIQSLQEGASGYITKPFGVDDLVQRIEQFLEDRRAADRGRER